MTFTDADVQLVAEAVNDVRDDTPAEVAHRVLTALADAGRLTPADAEVEEEWTYGEVDRRTGLFEPEYWDHVFDSRAEAEAVNRGGARIAHRERIAGPWVAADGTP